MKKIGHHPGLSEAFEGWSFRRCRCGLVLALSASGRIWWVRANSPLVAIEALEMLLAALATECRYYRGRAPATPAHRVESRASDSALPALPQSLQPAGPTERAASAVKPVVIVKPRRRTAPKGGA
jgi:hypothetical protein